MRGAGTLVVTLLVTVTVAAAALAGCSRSGESATTQPAAVPVIEEVDCGGPAPVDEVPPVEPPASIPTELVVEDLRPGSGPAAETGDTVYIDYTGIRAADGVEFDSSYAREVPLDFPLGRGDAIPGMELGLVGARAGMLRRLDVPAALAYGDSPPDSEIRPGDALTFMIEVRAVVPASTADDAPSGLDLPPSVGATGVTVDDLVAGDGPVLRLGDTAIVHVLLVRGDNEVVLLNTWGRGSPLIVDLTTDSASLPGIVQGLQCAAVGGLRAITIPPAWAFGPDGGPTLGLPAGTDLIVVAQVLGSY
jgi:peptidylprolyl isomerase